MGSYIGWMLVGAIVGVAAGHSVFAMLVGVAVAWLGARLAVLSREVGTLRQKLEQSGVRHERSTRAPAAADVAATEAPPPPAVTTKPAAPLAPWQEKQASTEVYTSEKPQPPVRPSEDPVEASSASAAPMFPSTPSGPSWPERAFQQAWRWLSNGNVPVKVGMLVIFVGVAAALKYASDIGLLRAPISVRLSLIAVAAMVALVFGWRQRTQRRVFALSLQGGAIGVLVMTVFAAFRLYHLIPPLPAFVLLVVLVGGIGLLAVLQDALALAVLGLLAGFAAPILVSTGQGSHVVLFSYYALLNLAIFGIAWWRSWRVLNVLGFVATFGIATAWGVLSYRPEQFASTEPFLILNFLFYLAIPWLYLRRPADGSQRVMDGALLFGNPLISVLLQGALLRWDPHALAISTLAIAVIYLVIAYGVRKQKNLGLLRDAWAILAITFATLTVPLAFGAQLTGSILALEGAGMVWRGFRQQRVWARWGGLGLQLFAVLALLLGRAVHPETGSMPVLNGDFLSMLFVVIAGFASCALYARRGDDSAAHRQLAVVLFIWGMLWWFYAVATESERFASWETGLWIWMAVLAVTAWLSAEVARLQPRHQLGRWIAFSVPAVLALMLPLLLWAGFAHQQPLWGWALASVVLAAILGWRTLICMRSEELPAALAQLAWLWRWGLIAVVAITMALHEVSIAPSWKLLLSSLPALLLFALALRRPSSIAPPLPKRVDGWREILLYSLLLVAIPVAYRAFLGGGDTWPLPFVPLLNPTDILLLLIGLGVFAWLSDPVAPESLRQQRASIVGLFVLVLVTSATLRGVHQLGAVPWDAQALGASSLAQMALTLVWSVMGLLAWVLGSRRGQRSLWMAGAVLLGVVLLKLLLVDRGHLGNVFGIASFIAYGLLCTLIGYLAPAPPKQGASEEKENLNAD